MEEPNASVRMGCENGVGNASVLVKGDRTVGCREDWKTVGGCITCVHVGFSVHVQNPVLGTVGRCTSWLCFGASDFGFGHGTGGRDWGRGGEVNLNT